MGEGEGVAFAGFPIGTVMLQAPGWLHQMSATLHAGIVAAVLPHPFAAFPHAFHIHANTQGGASGSPVFRPDGRIVGMVYSGIRQEMSFGTENGFTSYLVPTAITGCVPGPPIQGILPAIEAQAATITGRPPFDEVIARATRTEDRGGTPWLEPWRGDGT